MIAHLTTILTSAVVASITGIAFHAWLEWRKNWQTTRLNALKISVKLEGYSLTCAGQLDNHNTAINSGGEAGSILKKAPAFPELVITVGILTYNKAKIANRLAILPQEHNQAEQAISFWWEVVGDQDCAASEAANQTARLGMEAFNLAKDIRRTFSLPKRELIFGIYNIEGVLSAKTDENM